MGCVLSVDARTDHKTIAESPFAALHHDKNKFEVCAWQKLHYRTQPELCTKWVEQREGASVLPLPCRACVVLRRAASCSAASS